MRFLMRRPEDRAFAWAANGCASILASIAAAQVAVSGGLHWILAAALIGYGLAGWGLLKANRTMAEQHVRGSHCGK
jgi:hypothetical protein